MSAIPGKQVHRELVALLGPVLEKEGFRRIRPGSTAAWSKPVGEQFLLVWVQLSRSGDPFGWYGTSLTVEFELSEAAVPGTGRPRERLTRLLSHKEREEIRRNQNAFIGRLPSAPTVALTQVPVSLRSKYLAHGDQHNEPYADNEDVWLRYADARDLQSWFPLLQKMVPAAIREAVIRFGVDLQL
ncbi:hypothetical protein [Leifsonia sp. 2MCAF36]|uniref:hypothetical protein n=1 Tax=Leifsonia sp. 2MCAF36 TaxID=3232988 RepID=UPI003F96E36E